MDLWRKILNKIESWYVSSLPLEKQAKKAGVKVGCGNFIASKFWSTEPYLIEIGNHCQITAGVKIFTHGGSQVIRSKYPTFDAFGKVKIGDYVYIGNNCLIMPGVILEDHVLVAAGSVVTKSVHSGSVVGGNPAQYICSIEEYITRNLDYNTESKGFSYKEKKNLLEHLPDDKFIQKSFLKKRKEV
jgi:acetyltransferase-like isoleucine patch superfamily enzyme